MAGPIDDMVAESPTPALFKGPAAPAPTYSTAADYVPPTPQAEPDPVSCLFSRVRQEGVTVEHNATATFGLDAVPAGIKAETWSVVILETSYRIAEIRRRIWEGVHAGWTLLLRG